MLIDVRTPIEFREIHAAGARNIPLDSLNPNTLKNECQGKSVYVICKAGSRGAKAQQRMLAAGIENVVNIAGGTDAWVNSDLPVNRGKKAVSLERQVRITAGFIAFAGSVAAIVTQNVYLAGIPAFIGAGLMFAGITDSCAMGMLLAKMPWNQVNNEEKVCEVK